MRTLFLVLICSVLVGCKQQYNKVERGKEPDVYLVESFDKEMEAAINNANKTLPDFEKALQSNNSNYTNFTLKMKFDTQDGGEHIWINDVWKTKDKYYGIVGNVPYDTKEVKLGDTVEVPLDRISDWMYFDKMKVVGGYTIRVFRNKMSPEERKQFDENYGAGFVD